MGEKAHQATKVIAVIAATCIALACGTNYAYSAWAPQFAERMRFSATQINLIGVAGNVGMYASGIPCGLLVDRKGPRLGAILGGIALGVGYFPIREAYEEGPGSIGVPLLFFFSFLTGLGSCAAFQAALKTSALNWPHHRGTATGLPLAAFGLSAFFYTTTSAIVFPDDTLDLLTFFTYGTSFLVFICIPFLRVVEQQPIRYSVLTPADDDHLGPPGRSSDFLPRPGSILSRHSTSTPYLGQGERSQVAFETYVHQERSPRLRSSESSDHLNVHILEPQDISSLVPESDDADPDEEGKHHAAHHLQKVDITGFALLPKLEFWQLWCLLGLLTGIGLMTINNIGNDVAALWMHYDETADRIFISKRQLFHVSVISVMSFLGRLASGVGSDILVKRLKLSRFWCVAASAAIFMVAQICAIRIENPNFLWAVSGFTGLAYGALFGVFPVLVVDAFGISGFSVNWGFMTIAPVVSGNVFNLCYGAIFDSHSTVMPGGESQCLVGLPCYATAYWITLISSIIGVGFALWGIRHEYEVKRRELHDNRRTV